MTSTQMLVAALVVLAVVGLVGFVVIRRPRSIEDEVARARGTTSIPTGSLPTPPSVPLRSRLVRSREALGGSLKNVFGRATLDSVFWESLEEALIGSDVGVVSATRIVHRVREASPGDMVTAREMLESELKRILADRPRHINIEGAPAVLMVVGVNGTGKTTSIGKIAKLISTQGRTTLLGAADTFRAAADTQLRAWADRVGVDMVGGQEGADPASVAFDAYAAAKARGRDVVIVDTAGRLHAKQSLMDELAKIRRVLEREAGVIAEVLLVLDATAGQNGIAQARSFAETAGVTGIVLTKLDGTARGGVVVAIEEELGVPVKLIGIGEGIDDLIPFDPNAFVDALLADA